MTPHETAAIAPIARATARQTPISMRFEWNRSLECEHDFEPLTVEGSLPQDLQGAFYRNGPGAFSVNGKGVTHPFEADGVISAVRLDGHTGYGACRITESAELKAERATGRVLYGPNASWMRRLYNVAVGHTAKNTANTNIIHWQGRLFALMEAGLPTEISAHDLRVVGATDLDKAVISLFSAHPHRVEAHRTLYGFGLQYGTTQTHVHLYALPDDQPAHRLGGFALPGLLFQHDFIATENHLVFFIPPVRIKPMQGLLQWGRFDEMLDWRSELGTEVICVPLARPNEPIRFTTDAFYQWHFANAFERDGRIFVDYVRYPEIMSAMNGLAGRPLPENVKFGRVHRAQIDLQRRSMHSEECLDVAVEFPTIAAHATGMQHRFIWLTRAGLNGIIRLDVGAGEAVAYQLPSHQTGGEATFVPRRGASSEEDGYVLMMCSDTTRDRAFLAIFDARDITSGPRAKVWFDHYIPTALHGTWVDRA